MFGIYSKGLEEIIKIIDNCKTIDKVVIYGSRAKENFKEGSDIDITLKGNVSLNDFNKLVNDLEDSYLPYKFDVSIYDNLKSENLKEHIERVGKFLYERTFD